MEVNKQILMLNKVLSDLGNGEKQVHGAAWSKAWCEMLRASERQQAVRTQ
jgi:hypothetical protein